jgi:hypothetical protein
MHSRLQRWERSGRSKPRRSAAPWRKDRLVVGINSEAVQDPAALARSPYGSGWLVRLRDVHPGREPTPLRGGSSLRCWFRDEVDRLLAMLAPAGQAASMADGGRMVPDLADRIDESQWAEIAARLFANPRA